MTLALIGLIDVDSILPNLALMKLSAYYKRQGVLVEFVKDSVQYDKIFASSIFSRSKSKCDELLAQYGERITIGGTGYAPKIKLPDEIHSCRPDYDLYNVDIIAPRLKGIRTREARYKKAQVIVDAGIGFTSRGCVRNCEFCGVPEAEGPFRQDFGIDDIINPRSNVLILHDNNITADPLCIDKLHEIRDRQLVVDFNQGLDVRLMTEKKAEAFSQVKYLHQIHYAWDLMSYENQVITGIKVLSRFIKTWRHLCFILVGFNTSFEEDMYRFRKLSEMGIDPYVMVYNSSPDARLRHFSRWVNSRICKACTFEEYKPWRKEATI